MDLKQAIADASATNRPLPINTSYYDQYMLDEEGKNKLDWKEDEDKNFYVPLMYKDKEGQLVNGGTARLQIDILPI